MKTQSHKQKEDEISFIDILLFLKASGRNVLLSTVVCLTAGATYYFVVPKMYEASATIQMAMVAGELVEAPSVLLEKIKLPLFLSAATLQACGSDGEPNSQDWFADKLKPTLNKSAPFITFSAQAHSTQEARACLEAVIGEIQNSQNELAKPLVEKKKQKLAQLTDQLKLSEDTAKNFPTFKAGLNTSDSQLSVRTLVMSSAFSNTNEMSDLRKLIFTLETDLTPPQTQPVSLSVPIYAPKAPINKRPLFTLVLSSALGVLLGLLVTGVIRLERETRRQMREAEMS
jgi:hypothetical protein